MTHSDHTPATVAARSGSAAPRRVRSRWWLAGLLVGCLLPAGLVSGEAARHAERIVQICLLAPHAIRAESRRVAWRCRWRARKRPHRLRLPQRIKNCREAPECRPIAAHDVLTRRGPPVCSPGIALR